MTQTRPHELPTTTARPHLRLSALVAQTAELHRQALAVRAGEPAARWAGPAGRFGPLHALVLARGEQLLDCSGPLFGAFVERVVVDGHTHVRPVLDALAPAAATAGRPGLPAALRAAACELLELAPAVPAGWRQHWRRHWHRIGRDGPAGGELFLDGLGRVLHRHVLALLATEALADVLPTRLLTAGRLSWRAACARFGVADAAPAVARRPSPGRAVESPRLPR